MALPRPGPQVLLYIIAEPRASKIVQAKRALKFGSMALRSLLQAEDG